jgi:hypothetical protein
MTHICALHVLLTLELVVEINIIFGGVGPRISLSADFNTTVDPHCIRSPTLTPPESGAGLTTRCLDWMAPNSTCARYRYRPVNLIQVCPTEIRPITGLAEFRAAFDYCTLRVGLEQVKLKVGPSDARWRYHSAKRLGTRYW